MTAGEVKGLPRRQVQLIFQVVGWRRFATTTDKENRYDFAFMANRYRRVFPTFFYFSR